MKIDVVTEALGEVKADAIVVGISADDKKLPATLGALDRQTGGPIAAVEGAILGTYVFDRYKRDKSEKTVETLRVVAPDRKQAREVTEGARRGEIFAQGTWLARDLINAPANDVHPTYVAEVARQIAKEGKLKIKV